MRILMWLTGLGLVFLSAQARAAAPDHVQGKVLLGSLIQLPTVIPEAIKAAWQERGPSVLVLRNNHK